MAMAMACRCTFPCLPGDEAAALQESQLLESLRDCAKKKDLPRAAALHLLTQQQWLHRSPAIAASLISAYARCGHVQRSYGVLECLHARGLLPFSALIAGYARSGQGLQALRCFERMQAESVSPNHVTFVSVLKACGSRGAIAQGKQIHSRIVRQGLLPKNVALGTALVDMYARCGLLGRGREVLEQLPMRNVVTWNALIARYAQQAPGHGALERFEEMQKEGIGPNQITFISLLKACGSVRAIEKGEQIHAEIASRGFLKTNAVLGNALVDMYAKCGMFAKAQDVLDELPIRNVESWNVIIAGYIQHGRVQQALACFELMQKEGLSPNRITFICSLKACCGLEALDVAEQIHAELAGKGLLEKDVALSTALVDMYAKCGALAKARETLHGLPVRDTASWNAFIAGCARQGQDHEALDGLSQMRKEGLSPSGVTFSCVLKACGNMGAIDEGKQIHDEIVERGLLKNNVVLGTALVDMYAKCCELEKAQQLLEDLHIRDVVAWNALIAGYIEMGQEHEALNCVSRMKSEGIAADEVTFACMLKACGSIGALDKGKQVHQEIANNGLLARNIVLNNVLVDMYAKCGAFVKAQEVLEELPVRGVVSWSALISGYAQEGAFTEVLDLFARMQDEGLSPDQVTLQCVLNVCNRSGRLDDAEMYYDNMSKSYGIAPELEHCTCMVAVFGQMGCLDKALSVIQAMPSSSSGESIIWLALLNGCKKWGNVKLGRVAFERILQQRDINLAAAYSLMASIYRAAGRHCDVEEIEAMRANYM